MPVPSIKPSERRNNPSLATTLNDGWRKYGGTGRATYASGTTFTLSGDHTADFTYGRKVRIYHVTAAAYKYVMVMSSSYGAGVTTVTVVGNTLLNQTYSSIWVDISPVGYAQPVAVPGALTAGDMLYAAANLALTALAIGTPGQRLKVSSSNLPAWSDEDGWREANETWTYSSVDNPTGVFTITGDKTTKYSVGMRIRFTNNSNTVYGIITAISYSAPNTTVKFLHEIDPATPVQALHVITNSAITVPFYSPYKNPYGFPSDPRSWTMQITDTSNRAQASPSQNTWYNLGSQTIAIPIGVWKVDYEVTASCAYTVGGSGMAGVIAQTTLSTANNSESDADFTILSEMDAYVSGGTLLFVHCHYRAKSIALTSKTSYYLNTRTTTTSMTSLTNENNTSKMFVRALCGYL